MKARDTIALTWRDAVSNGYRDLFPCDTFATAKAAGILTHAVVGPKGGTSVAKCRIKVRGSSAELDYAVFGAFNTAKKNFLGVARLEFADSDRTAISRVWWKEEGAPDFELTEFETAAYELAPVPPYVGSGKKTGKVLKKVRERPGQAAFRRRLKLAYGNTCCISGCMVAEALEGAHIDRYLGPDFDHIQNGLLLRRDIHMLFDAHLIGIEPKNRTLHVAEAARVWPEYAALHGHSLRAPSLGGKTYQPATHALERRWTIFTVKHGV